MVSHLLGTPPRTPPAASATSSSRPGRRADAGGRDSGQRRSVDQLLPAHSGSRRAPGTGPSSRATAVGNCQQANEIDTFVIDTTAAPLPATTTPNEIVYSRNPWGTNGTGGTPAYSLNGNAGAVEANANVVVYSLPSTDSSSIGSGQADGTGAFN